MPANVYEYLFILDSSKLGGDIAAADRQLRTIVEKHGGVLRFATNDDHGTTVIIDLPAVTEE